ncbi:class II aldolase/adducin family protein [Paenibacillus sp. DMB20]|uniref:class II aldolase/adducin family protein n=1 Tax=Paenibacillus sp. DMB20 TaxID=1642570 RepID=UPI000627EDB7|nr:class II aldolase/adducin family protein [Paenibacillus sp. DMB20]KKO53418.1 aldolase [Paenibacillus sp. DMB20]
MQTELLHPADQLLMMMERIYGYGMTTTSGGNLSILDENGDIWITPAGVDKGALTRSDMVCVKEDGTVIGHHKPSSEYPFHRLIYRSRPDLKAVVHAHPPALVSFSIVRRIPNTKLLPNEELIVGEVGMAEYALPGSESLGENIAKVFARGINCVMLENHGVVVGGGHLFEAFRAFETLEYCARLEINAHRIGKPVSLLEVNRNKPQPQLEEFTPVRYSTEEREVRGEMCRLISRAYDQSLFTSTQGTFSQRLSDGSFVITPYGDDRKYLQPGDLVRIKDGKQEAGKLPSRSVRFHELIYKTQPHVKSIIIAHPPHIMAFAVTDTPFDSRTIPESYILLRDMPKLPFGMVVQQADEAAGRFKKDTPLAIAANDCVVVTGSSLLNAFDRLEVAEYSAKAFIDTFVLGPVRHIAPERIEELKAAFRLD